MGKGIAKSRRLEGDLDGEREEGVGEPGVARILDEEGDLGDDDASSRVRVEGLPLCGRAGRSARGKLGIGL